MEYFSPDLQTGWIVAAHRVPDTQVTVSRPSLIVYDSVNPSYVCSPQISDLTSATAYVFLVRAENSQGVSVPSGLSNAIKTLGEDFDVTPSNELSAARTLLTGKVSRTQSEQIQFNAYDYINVQVVELIDASAVNASAVRLDWMLHVSANEKFVEVSCNPY